MTLKDFQPCQACRLRDYSERKPDGFIARLWRWHTRWCPGWKRYQRWLAQQSARHAGQTERRP